MTTTKNCQLDSVPLYGPAQQNDFSVEKAVSLHDVSCRSSMFDTETSFEVDDFNSRYKKTHSIGVAVHKQVFFTSGFPIFSHIINSKQIYHNEF